MRSKSVRSFWVLLLLVSAGSIHALTPDEVFILANRAMPESRELAEHYCSRRGVPTKNIVLLDLPRSEDISRSDYERLLLEPVRQALQERKDKVKVLLSIYGVPLRVGPQQPSPLEKEELGRVQNDLGPLQLRLRDLNLLILTMEAEGVSFPAMNEAIKDRKELMNRLKPLEDRRASLMYSESQASVDSELSLLWWNTYELRRWHLNMFYFRVTSEVRENHPPMVMTARLDGPTPALVKRLVDDAVEVEKQGLSGNVCIDARGIAYDSKNDGGYGYGAYDESLREMAQTLEKEGKFSVMLDNRSALLEAETCSDVALYCGWYSLGKYVPCAKFRKGAVAYHIASSEAVSLRNPHSQLWCKSLLEDGVAVTLGPVAEPYTIGFPKPAEFFTLLATGKYPVVECYWKTMMLTSWMTVLVGDPLYNPYGKARPIAESHLKPSPLGISFNPK